MPTTCAHLPPSSNLIAMHEVEERSILKVPKWFWGAAGLEINNVVEKEYS